MKQKIKKMFMATLLSVAVLGMSVSALPASAAQGSEPDCGHTSKTYKETIITYPHADQWTHQKLTDEVWVCDDCQTDLHEKRYVTEPHKQIPGTVFCECGYQLH